MHRLRPGVGPRQSIIAVSRRIIPRRRKEERRSPTGYAHWASRSDMMIGTATPDRSGSVVL